MAKKPSMFRPGDTVVCINADFQGNPYPAAEYIETPRSGSTYTIRDVTPVEQGGYGVRVHQIKNKPMPMNGKDHILEPCFDEKRFKKIRIIPLVAM